MAFSIEINAVDKTTYLTPNTLGITWRLNGRDTLDFGLKDLAGSYRPTTGQEVVIKDAGTRIIGGTIDEITESRLDRGSAGRIMCRCTGYTHRLDKRFIIAKGQAQTFTANAGTDVLSATRHGLGNNTVIEFTTTGTLPAGLSLATSYYVIDRTESTFKVSLAEGGSVVDITDAGSGVHTVGIVVPVVYGGHFKTNAAGDFLESPLHGVPTDMPVQVASTDTLPGGLSAATTYYTTNPTIGSFQLSATLGGAAINITSAGTGAHRFFWFAGKIISDVLANVTPGEIINAAGNIQNGAVVEILPASYKNVSELFDELAILSNFVWHVDENQDFFFVSRTAYSAPISLTDAGTNFIDISIRRTREDFADRVHYRLGWEAFSVLEEAFVGDTTTVDFVLAYRVAALDSILVNDVPVDFATYDAGGQDWTYVPNESAIHQIAGTPLTGTDSLKVRYRPMGQNVVTAQDQTVISARLAVEGGSGVYELYTENLENTSADKAVLDSAALLDAKKYIVAEADIITDTPGLRPRQLLPITLTVPQASGTWLINEVIAQDIDGMLLRYRVKALDGTRLANYIQFFQALASSGSGGGISQGSGGGGGTSPALFNHYYDEQTLSAATTEIASPATPTTGDIFVKKLTQDATGGREITWHADFDASTPIEINRDPNGVTTLTFLGTSGGKWLTLSVR